MNRISRYFLQVSNEIVKMKPSNIFHDDNSSTARYWNKSSISRWNKECINRAKSNLSFTLLVKIVILTILLVGFGYLLFSWIHPESSPTNDRNKAIFVNSTATNLSITTNSSMTEESTQIKHLNKIATFESSSTTKQPSTNVISYDDEHAEKSTDDDDVLLTKIYVERINFYTTSNKNLFSGVKVSPTLPSIINKHDPTTELPMQSYVNDNSCQSTSLPLCQGILSYDLTDPQQKWNLTNIEYQHFQHLLNSECSKRVAEFVCHMLEPECRPSRMKNLKP
ncbi:CLUMA_CG001832, isoform A [Clunio marinus]|uniref:CLUMA_CG001832, isoform A n=1 Tax=Clunio marinus TaxID=568069 RepID=A0A1J1HNK2_9DIPT|nr:CLUMA_CG001832, isoform A [Clunio marinus]